MIDELEDSAVKLATSEREQAWREMAKQVAHVIKNPLTPLRLTVQSFQRKFDPEDEQLGCPVLPAVIFIVYSGKNQSSSHFALALCIYCLFVRPAGDRFQRKCCYAACFHSPV